MADKASWDGKASSIPAFIDNLFSKDVRDIGAVTAAATGGSNNYSFVTDATRGLILNTWLAAWQAHQNDKYDKSAHDRCPDSDKKIISMLSDYIKTNKMRWHVPDISFSGVSAAGSSLAVYTSKGYQSRDFLKDGKWNYGKVDDTGTLSKGGFADDTVVNFLMHFFYGGHIVVVTSPDDLAKSDKPTQFRKAFDGAKLSTAQDPSNSHYSMANLTGHYYLDIDEDKEPSSGPLIAAFLTALTDPVTVNDIGGGLFPDRTASVIEAAVKKRHDASNSFIQLEGWQARASTDKDTWHMIDYDSSLATLWNFSTFGACAYSEKRSIPLFLAPASFSLDFNADTHMPSYNGASKRQSWMHPDLLKLAPSVVTKPTPTPPPNQ